MLNRQRYLNIYNQSHIKVLQKSKFKKEKQQCFHGMAATDQICFENEEYLFHPMDPDEDPNAS